MFSAFRIVEIPSENLLLGARPECCDTSPYVIPGPPRLSRPRLLPESFHVNPRSSHPAPLLPAPGRRPVSAGLLCFQEGMRGLCCTADRSAGLQEARGPPPDAGAAGAAGGHAGGIGRGADTWSE